MGGNLNILFYLGQAFPRLGTFWNEHCLPFWFLFWWEDIGLEGRNFGRRDLPCSLGWPCFLSFFARTLFASHQNSCHSSPFFLPLCPFSLHTLHILQNTFLCLPHLLTLLSLLSSALPPSLPMPSSLMLLSLSLSVSSLLLPPLILLLFLLCAAALPLSLIMPLSPLLFPSMHPILN